MEEVKALFYGLVIFLVVHSVGIFHQFKSINHLLNCVVPLPHISYVRRIAMFVKSFEGL